MGEVRRKCSTVFVSADTVAADAEVVVFEEFAGGLLIAPTGAAAQTISWYVTYAPGGEYVPCYDSTGTQAQTVIGAAARGYEIPPAVAGAYAIKLVAGTSDASLILCLKG